MRDWFEEKGIGIVSLVLAVSVVYLGVAAVWPFITIPSAATILVPESIYQKIGLVFNTKIIIVAVFLVVASLHVLRGIRKNR